MPTALITHPACLNHDTGPYHPECPDRLRAVLAAVLIIVAGKLVL